MGGNASQVELVQTAIETLETSLLASIPKWNATYDHTFFSSGTITANGNTGVIATPLVTSGSDAIIPIAFTLKGADMTVDETNTVTIDWYLDSAGEFTIGTTTFVALTWTDLLAPVEAWPGDVTLFNNSDVGAMTRGIPLPPFHKITHVLAGAAKSMSFIIKLAHLSLGI